MRHWYSLQLLALFLLFPLGIYADYRIQITTDNLSYFQIVNSKKPTLACYLLSYQLGTLSTKNLKVGAIWSAQDIETLNLRIKNLRTKIRKAKNRAQYTKVSKLQAKLANQKQIKRTINQNSSKCQDPDPSDQFLGRADSMNSYREDISEAEIQHLLRKVAFGGNAELLRIGREEGLSALVDALVEPNGQENKLMADAMKFGNQGFFYENDDPNYPIYTPYVLRAAQIYRFIYSNQPFKEWMILNLSGHFSVNLNRIGFAYSSYSHQGMREFWDLLINNSLGNFRTLTIGMLTDKAMNFWLDNKDNQIGAPNQNFGRELLELFILGKNDPVTGIENYQEDSVIAATGFLSGYYEDASYDSSRDDYTLMINYNPELHDNTIRTIFANIAGVEINQTFSPAGFINYVFDHHPATPRFIAERFAGMMLYPGLPEKIVAELAAELKNNNYYLPAFYKKILKSEAFFSNTTKDSCFSSPLEQIITLARKIFPAELTTTGEYGERAFYLLTSIAENAAAAGQAIFEPPSVFGWKGSCNINRNGAQAAGEGWIKTQRLLNRSNACAAMMDGLNWYELDFLSALKLSVAASPREIVQQIARNVFNLELLPAEEDLIIYYLRTFRGSYEGEDYDYQQDPDLSENWIVRGKIPRTICLIYDLGFNNFR